jgi:hypothetical protein
MASPHEVDLLRVFISVPPYNVSQDYIPRNTAFSVVVEAELGEALFGTGASFRVNVVLLDITAGTTFPLPPLWGAVGSAIWPLSSQQLTFPVVGQPSADHILQAVAVLIVGVAHPIVRFEESKLAVVIE